MNTQQLKDRHRRHVVIIVTLAILAFNVALSVRPSTASSVLTDEQLFDAGYAGYQRDDFLTAVVYLYAYIQRNPQALSNTEWADEVNKAFSHSWSTVDFAFKLGVEEQRRQAANSPPPPPGLGRTTGGITVKPTLNQAPVFGKPKANSKKCDMYATLAVAQNELNLKHGCGLTGGRWNSQFDDHYNWCVEQTEDTPDVETAERQKSLNVCANAPSRSKVRDSIVRP